MTDFVLEITLARAAPQFPAAARPARAGDRPERRSAPAPTGCGGAEAGGTRLLLHPGRGRGGPGGDPRHPAARRAQRDRAVARFAAGEAELVVGGTAGDLPIARAADLPANRLVLRSGRRDVRPRLHRRRAAARRSRGAARAGDGARPRRAGGGARAAPRRAHQPGRARRPGAAGAGPARLGRAPRSTSAAPWPRAPIAGLGLRGADPPRVAMPDGPGYRLAFAYLQRDWRMIGVESERVAIGRAGRSRPRSTRSRRPISPAGICATSPATPSALCDPAADQALLAARLAPRAADRQAQLANADRILTELVPFIPLTAPVRWSLVAPRLTGFRPNAFARHPAVVLIAERQ